MGDRGYVGHFLFFPLPNDFKDELRKNTSTGVIPSDLFMFVIYFYFFVKLFDSYSIKCKAEK
jgi:hypothetical protein